MPRPTTRSNQTLAAGSFVNKVGGFLLSCVLRAGKGLVNSSVGRPHDCNLK
jgi:hypothetical protein